MRGVPLSLGLSLILVASLPAAERSSITLDAYFGQIGIGHSLISPNGKQVAYVETRWTKGAETREAQLCVVQSNGGPKRSLTSVRFLGPDHLRWSSNSTYLYYTDRQSRDIKTLQVWRIGAAGGEPELMTHAPSDVQAFVLAPDDRTIYVQLDVELPDTDWRGLKERYKTHIDFGHGPTRVSQIWRVDDKGKPQEKVVEDKRFIRDIELSPDGKRLALITAPDDRVLTAEGQSRVEVCDLATGKLTQPPEKPYREDAASPYGWLEHLAWSPDSKAVAFNVIFDGYPSEIFVADLADAKPRVFKMERPDNLSLRGYGSPIQWRADQELCFLGEERARVRLCCATNVRAERQGIMKILTQGDHVVDHFSISQAGEQTALVLNDTTHLPDLFLLNGGKPKEILRLNPQVNNWKLPRYSIVTWKGARGDTVEGILELPPDYVEGQKVPLIVEIHGGPTSASYYHLNFSIFGRTLLPARGIAVLSPNYRGSTGYGDKFLTDLLGKENDLDVEDILKGVDSLVQKGIADKDRLGVMGWSNGGYLTNCILTKTERFKAASSGAGIVDPVMEWGTNDEPAYVIALKQGFPWTNKGEAYRKAAVTYDLNKIRTPTLIHVGSNDDRCPPGHSRMLYRALKEYNKVAVELLVYKGEGHGLSKASNRRAKMEWDLAWFEHYLLDK